MASRSKKRKAGQNAGMGRSVPAKEVFAFRLPSWFRHDWVWGLLLLLAVIAVYQPIWSAGFIWDDDVVLTSNPVIVGPLGLKEIWTTSAAQFYPLVLTSLWAEHALWGLAPWPYHLVNVLQHGLSAILLWRVLRSLQIPGAWLGAALWALHPVQVESVAWITEMKNTQSTLFYLLSILFFLKGLKNPGTWNYAFTLLFAAMAMASKSSTVVLPVVLGLCAWWVEGRWRWRNLPGLIPVFLMSVASSVITLWSLASDKTATLDLQEARGWLERVAAAGDVVWFYPGKLLWPHPLLTVYPRWQIDAGQWFSYLPLAAAIIVLFVLWLKRESPCRPLFFAFAYFLTALLPFLGLIDQGFWRYSFVADHFQYLADMGPLALAGAGIVWLSDFVLPGKAWLVSTLGTGLLLVLGLLSWQQARIYESQETLWSYTLLRNPHCWAGYNSLGNMFFQKGQVDEAMINYQRALEIKPNYVEAHNNLGDALLQKEQLDEAIVQFQKALVIDPNHAQTDYNLGNAFFQKGQITEAIFQYKKTLKINPNYAPADYNLGNALFLKGQVDEAIVRYKKALEINLNYAEARNNLGIALVKKGELDEAAAQFQEALRLKPGYREAQNNLAKIKSMK